MQEVVRATLLALRFQLCTCLGVEGHCEAVLALLPSMPAACCFQEQLLSSRHGAASCQCMLVGVMQYSHCQVQHPLPTTASVMVEDTWLETVRQTQLLASCLNFSGMPGRPGAAIPQDCEAPCEDGKHLPL